MRHQNYDQLLTENERLLRAANGWEKLYREAADEIKQLKAELNQAPDELLAHDNSQLRAEIEQLRAEIRQLRTVYKD